MRRNIMIMVRSIWRVTLDFIIFGLEEAVKINKHWLTEIKVYLVVYGPLLQTVFLPQMVCAIVPTDRDDRQIFVFCLIISDFWMLADNMCKFITKIRSH